MFEVAGIDKVSPTRTWRQYNRVGGIEKAASERYYTSAKHAFVIRVRNPQTFPSPFSLAHLDENLRPPQSYTYLRDELFDRTRVLAGHSSTREPVAWRLLAGMASMVLTPAGR